MDNSDEIRGHLAKIRGSLSAIEILMVSQEPAVTPVKRAERPLAESFEAFWALYPRKVGKGAAERAWKTHVASGHEKRIVEAIRGQLGQADWVKEGGKYIPHPTTWLNQHRWLDEVKGGSDGSGKYGGLGETL